MQIKSPIYTILLSKSNFSFALLLVTFELLEVEQSYIPLLKALVSGINAVGAQGCGCMFRLCHTSLKMGLLLHKTEKVCRLMLSSVCSPIFLKITVNDYYNLGHFPQTLYLIFLFQKRKCLIKFFPSEA